MPLLLHKILSIQQVQPLERMRDPLEFSNLVSMQPLERLELVKESLALGLLTQAQRPPLSVSTDASTYYYEASNR